MDFITNMDEIEATTLIWSNCL